MMNRPPIEEWLYNERSVSAEESVKVVQLGLYALDLEARLKEAEEAIDFTGCVFEGPPPDGYESWSDWAYAKTKTNAVIKSI